MKLNLNSMKIAITICLILFVVACGKTENKSQSGQSSSATSDPFDSLSKTGQAFKPGTYAKGHIPKGDYAFVSPKGGYFSEEFNGQILANENFASFGYVYVQGIGDITTRGYLISMEGLKQLSQSGALSIYKSMTNSADYNFSGYYKVGLDIDPGSYKLTSSSDGYVSIESGPLGHSKTIRNDIFNGEKTVSVSSGQYLVVTRASITPMSTLPQGKSTTDQALKVDSIILALKASSNPFELRKRALGKRVETQIFSESFIDEGNYARVIDGNSGIFCIMTGTEFGKHNKKGYKVVQGILMEDEGKFGLNDCSFVSDESGWKAPDNAYEELIK